MLTISEIRNGLQPLFSKYHIKKAILFGSHVKNKATLDSDIDLVIDTDITGFKFLRIENEISDVFNRKIDLIPKRCIEIGSEIERVINTEGVVVYET